VSPTHDTRHGEKDTYVLLGELGGVLLEGEAEVGDELGALDEVAHDAVGVGLEDAHLAAAAERHLEEGRLAVEDLAQGALEALDLGRRLGRRRGLHRRDGQGEGANQRKKKESDKNGS
jgi:hypothetical protein